MGKPIIEVQNLSKRYQLGRIGATTLREDLTRMGRRLRGRDATPQAGSSAGEFWALREVSFDVQPGEVLGVIGSNGAGKSTLLKILSRITEPSSGRAVLRGRVASLLEVGTGFHPDLTGRENVFLNGAILGMKAAEVTARFDEIVAFAEVEKFIDTPVKHYSSGMRVRLAFAVAAHLDSEILIVDEVLAVGDASFQQRCLRRMENLSRAGERTVLLVSHQTPAIVGICQRAIWLSQGTVRRNGTTQDVIHDYLAAANTPSSAIGEVRGTQVLRVKAQGADGQGRVIPGEPVHVTVEVQIDAPSSAYAIGVGINSELGERIATLHTQLDSSFVWSATPGRATVSCVVPHWPFKPGFYGLEANITNAGSMLHRLDVPEKLTVTPVDFFHNGGRYFTGPIIMPQTWSIAADRTDGLNASRTSSP